MVLGLRFFRRSAGLASCRIGCRGLCGRRCRDLGFLLLHLELLLHLAAVTEEFLRRGKFAEAVPHHVFGYEDIDVRLAIVHPERKADHLRSDLGAARPRLNDPGGCRLLAFDLLHQFGVDVGTFVERA